jgi:hypothetical protein
VSTTTAAAVPSAAPLGETSASGKN